MSQIEDVITNLRARIMSGNIKPDERLMEVPISQELGVSRTPVRIALSALEREGLVTTDGPKRGFYVRSFDIEEVFQAIELRGALEGIAARKLAEEATDPVTITHLKSAIEACEQLLTDGVSTPEKQQAWIDNNAKFHTALISGADNKVLRNLIETLSRMPLVSSRAVPLISGATEDQHLRLRRAHEDHEDILDAIVSRNGMRAEMLIREHAVRNVKNKRANFWKMKFQSDWNNLPGLDLVVNEDSRVQER